MRENYICDCPPTQILTHENYTYENKSEIHDVIGGLFERSRVLLNAVYTRKITLHEHNVHVQIIYNVDLSSI